MKDHATYADGLIYEDKKYVMKIIRYSNKNKIKRKFKVKFKSKNNDYALTVKYYFMNIIIVTSLFHFKVTKF